MKATFQHCLKWVIATGLIVLVVACSQLPMADAETISLELIDGKQHYPIADIFEHFYSNINNPEMILGQPISHPFSNPENGNLTQYFRNFRLEAQTDEFGRISIIPSDLGTQLFDPMEREMLIIDENCTHFSSNPFPVCHHFRQFYETHQGQALFGEPISYVFQQNNRFYQYFENTCLIWEPISNTVSLAPLGENFLSTREPFRFTIVDPEYPELMIVDSVPTDELTVEYTVKHPFLSPEWEQTVTIYVSDQNGLPVENAGVTAWVILPDGEFEVYRPIDTNQDGISSFTIPALAATGVQQNDTIKMRIEVNANGLSGQVIGWFRIWL